MKIQKISVMIYILLILIMSISTSTAGYTIEVKSCKPWGLSGTAYMCFTNMTNIVEKWFPSYMSMHRYYSPPMMESMWSISNISPIGYKYIKITQS